MVRRRMQYSQVGKRIFFSHDIVSNLTAWKKKTGPGPVRFRRRRKESKHHDIAARRMKKKDFGMTKCITEALQRLLGGMKRGKLRDSPPAFPSP